MGQGHYHCTRLQASPVLLALAMSFGDKSETKHTVRDANGEGVIVSYTSYRWRGSEYVSNVTIESFGK